MHLVLVAADLDAEAERLTSWGRPWSSVVPTKSSWRTRTATSSSYGPSRDGARVLTLAVVVAHPDDDAYGIAGTVALHLDDETFRLRAHPCHRRRRGRHPSRVPRDARDPRGGPPRGGRGGVARGRPRAGPSRWLGYPDGEVDRVPFDELVEAVVAVLEEEQPTVVFTFGPDGIFGHPDHIAIGAATDAAFAGPRRRAAPPSAGCCTAPSRSRSSPGGTSSAPPRGGRSSTRRRPITCAGSRTTRSGSGRLPSGDESRRGRVAGAPQPAPRFSTTPRTSPDGAGRHPRVARRRLATAGAGCRGLG